jgi:hypothetical protein
MVSISQAGPHTILFVAQDGGNQIQVLRLNV